MPLVKPEFDVERPAREPQRLLARAYARRESGTHAVVIDKPIPLARQIGICFGLLLATGVLLLSVERHYPLQHWLFFRYAGYWLGAGVWSIACAATGHRLLRWILGRPLPWLEQLAMAQALGVFAFQLAMFLLGVLGLYGRVTFVGLPAVFLLIGGRPFARSLRRGWLHLRAPRRRRGLTPITWLAIVFGIASLIALYLPVMAAVNSSFDARWRHLYIAEQYALHGGIRRFDEGWSLGASPHFASLIYTWGFMFDGGLLFDRVELCAHLEYVVFLWTTFAGIPALVRRLVPRANPAAVWAARFLFPGTFLFDSNLSVGADHLGAVFGPALLLVGLRMWRNPSSRRGLLMGALIAAPLCSKETTALLLAPFSIALVVVRFGLDLVRGLRARCSWQRLAGSVLAGLMTVVLTAPHWLKNWLWYGDPLYPNLHAWSADRPFSPYAAYTFEYGFKTMLWAPTRDLDGLRDALQAIITFSFRPHGWWSMHRDVPVLGSLCTLLFLVLPFLRGARRIWLVMCCVHFSVFVWFWVHHEERHLQAIVPWMAAAVAASATLIWRETGAVTRGALALLILTQAVWGADVYFFPTHSMTGAAALKAPTELLAQGYLGNYQRRFDYQMEQVRIGESVPASAVLLVHERRDHLGYARKTLTDFTGDQYGLDYLALRTPDRIYERLRSLGVTHLVWLDNFSVGIDALGGDLAFYNFAFQYTEARRRIGSYWVASMPKNAPSPPPEPRLVAVVGCGVDYPSGIYSLEDLDTPRFGPSRRGFRAPREPLGEGWDWYPRVFAFATDPKCSEVVPPPLVLRAFGRVARRDDRWGRGHQLWLRRQ